MLEERQKLVAKYSEARGVLLALSTHLKRQTADLAKPLYKDIDRRLADTAIQYNIRAAKAKQINAHHDAAEQGLMEFHHQKMKEINRQLADFWKMTYRGNDI